MAVAIDPNKKTGKKPVEQQAVIGNTVASSQYNPYAPSTTSGVTAGNAEGIIARTDDEADLLYREGIAGGAATQAYGYGVAAQGSKLVGQSANYARDDRAAAQAYGAQGAQIAQQGMSRQDQAINSLIGQASARTPSQAVAQLNMAQDKQAGQMVAQAASARGGNAAAAMRNAQSQASANALTTNQQAAVLRAGEEQARQQNILAAQQYASSAYGDRAKVGVGVQDAALGRASTSTGQIGQAGGVLGGIGTDIAGQGVQQQGVYVAPTAAFDGYDAQKQIAQMQKEERERAASFAAAAEIAKTGPKIWASIAGAKGEQEEEKKKKTQ